MIDYLQNENIKDLFKNNFLKIRKSTETLASLLPDEFCNIENNELITYVKNNEEIIEETRNEIKENHIIARNLIPIGFKDDKLIYNEWLIPEDIWKKNYNTSVDTKFRPYKKNNIIKAILIDENVLKILGSKDLNKVKIKVDWNDTGMFVFKNGYLTDQGYGIEVNEFNKTYEIIF